MAIARFSALRHRDFRLWWSGYVISVAGFQMLWVVEGWLIYELSGSKLLLGANGLAQAIPATLLSLFGGVIADKVDQRRLLIAVQAAQVILLGILAALALTETVLVWHVIAASFALSAVGAFENPARQAMFPHLVDRNTMSDAVALNATVHPGTRVLGPPLAGFILAQVISTTSSAMVAAGTVFTITGLGFAIYAVALWMVHSPSVRRAGGRSVVADLNIGVAYIWRNRIFAVLIGMAYYNMFFGLALSVLFPVFAKDILAVGPSGLGFMYMSMGVGSLAGAMISGGLGRPDYQRRLLVGGALGLGVFMALFALSSWYPASLALLLLIGLGGSMFNVATQTNLQLLVTNELRGRVMGVWSMVHTSVRPLGEMQMSGMAAVASAPFALALGGLLIIVFAALFAMPNRHIRSLGNLRAAASAESEGPR